MSKASKENTTDLRPPWNFSWVVNNELAAMAYPENQNQLQYLIDQGLGHLVTLSPEMKPPIHTVKNLEWTCIDIEEFEAPELKDIVRFIDICEKTKTRGKAVGVHCRMGRGRTGVMAACYLVRFHGVTPDRALINLRLQRPGSVETTGQERAIRTYFDFIRSGNVMLQS